MIWLFLNFGVNLFLQNRFIRKNLRMHFLSRKYSLEMIYYDLVVLKLVITKPVCKVMII